MAEQASEKIEVLESKLNHFNPAARAAALDELVGLMQTGAITVAPEQPVANMHAHTFFSFNAYGYSPSALAWLAKKRGFRLIGTVDFDVLDAVDEFLAACDKVGVRGSAGIETRVFIPEFADREINSPGEPGVLYHMGIGFTSSRVPAGVAPLQQNLQWRAQQRNLGLIERINPYLAPVEIDYQRDVLSLSPGGTPTERHIALAYTQMARKVAMDVARFWAEKLEVPREAIDAIIDDSAKLQNLVRSKLMKRGGVGYVEPDHHTFPAIEPFHELIVACGALPCAAWLDGTLPGEQAMPELLDLLISKGAVALNIIPDRNWNIADPDTKQRKLQNLYDVVALAAEHDLPLNIGTEMNSFGQKVIDDFAAPELDPMRDAFLDGAHFIYGHTVMQRLVGMGYPSAWAQAHLPSRRERNDFYTKIGYAVPGGTTELPVNDSMNPAEILQKLNTN